MPRWSRTTLYTAVALVGAGFLLIGLAWNGAAEKDFIQGQFPYLISGGLTGLGLVLAGLVVVIVHSSRRDTGALVNKLDQLIEAVNDLAARQAGAGSAPPGPTAVPGAQEMVLAGARTYHRPGCRVVEGRDGLQPMAEAVAAARGLAACRICQPTGQQSA